MNKQTQLLENTLSHLQEARALLSEYYTSTGETHQGSMVMRLNGLVNEVNLEMYRT